MNASIEAPPPPENALDGGWIMSGTSVVGDEACLRIQALIDRHFEHVADHPAQGAWRSLFRDPRDGRLWERTYPKGEMHGGGPPALRVISAHDAKIDYGL